MTNPSNKKLLTPNFMSLPSKPVLIPVPDPDIAEQPTAIMAPITPIPGTLPTITEPIVIDRPFFTGTISLPPSINMAYKPVLLHGHPRIISAPALEAFKGEAALMLADRQRTYVDWPVLEALRCARRKTPMAIRLHIYFATEWKRDLDGIFKHAIDAVFTFLQLNDNLIVRVEADKLVDQVDPRIEIEVRCVAR